MVKTFPFLKEDGEFYYDRAKAETVIEFIEKFCKLWEPIGKPFKLLPWQRQLILDVFGWYRRDNGERRFAYVYVEVPRKNGKTYLVAAILIWLLMGEGKGAEVYASACTRDQSGIIFLSVCRMIRQSAFLSARLKVLPYKSEVHYANGGGVLKALSGEATGAHGKYPTAIVCDELHEWKTPKAASLYEALTSGFGDRKSPLALHITTAGFGGDPTIAKKMHERALLFEQGKSADSTFYGVVYGASLEDDWRSEDVWKKANPSYAMAAKNLRREYQLAKTEASEENKFKRLYLNIWTQQQTRWLDLAKYKACVAPQDSPLTYDDLKGRTVILGLDLSQIYDLTAIALLFPMEDGTWRLLVRCYMPRNQIARRSAEDGTPYDEWERAGYLIATDGISKGETIDYATIVEDIRTIAKECDVLTVGYDPAAAVMVIPQLESEGLHCSPIYQRHSDMSPASKEFERRIATGEITIERNPCLEWQAGNVEVIYDADNRIKPVKPNTRGTYGGSVKYKVDGIVASVIGVQAALLTMHQGKEDEGTPAIYYA